MSWAEHYLPRCLKTNTQFECLALAIILNYRILWKPCSKIMEWQKYFWTSLLFSFMNRSNLSFYWEKKNINKHEKFTFCECRKVCIQCFNLEWMNSGWGSDKANVGYELWMRAFPTVMQLFSELPPNDTWTFNFQFEFCHLIKSY